MLGGLGMVVGRVGVGFLLVVNHAGRLGVEKCCSTSRSSAWILTKTAEHEVVLSRGWTGFHSSPKDAVTDAS